MHFAAFDVTTDNRDDVIALLKQWTEMAERMTQGHDAVPNGAIGGNPYAPPDDTGEALGLPASALTLTIGFGPSFFDKDGKDRFGIADQRPAGLADLPKFTNEILDPAKCGGDICVQACAHDPQVAVHAIRNLARVGFGTVAVRYSQLGFGRTSSTTREQSTPRNMLGFKDGTNNLKAEDTEALDKNVWVAAGDGPDWLAGGTYLVTRRIRNRIEAWDRTTLLEQERVIGRQKGSGAPNGYDDEFAPLDFDIKDANGTPLVDVDAHVRLVVTRSCGRRQDAAPRVQLHRRLRRIRPSGCRTVLHRVRAEPNDELHPGAGADVRRRAQRVHLPYGHSRFRLPARAARG